MTPADIIAFEGESKPITEWALDYGITPGIIIARLERGDTVAHAITSPMKIGYPGQKLRTFHPAQRRNAKAPVRHHRQQHEYKRRKANEPVAFNGRSMTLKEWAEHTGISYGTIASRLRNGWTLDETLTTPVGATPADALQDASTGGRSRLPNAIGTGGGSVAREKAEMKFSNLDTETR